MTASLGPVKRAIDWSPWHFLGVTAEPPAVRRGPAPTLVHGDRPHRIHELSHRGASSPLTHGLADRAPRSIPACRRTRQRLSLIHISEPTRLGMISYAVFCLKKK